MPALLLCSFISASIGLASLAFVLILFAHRPSRVAVSYLCINFAAWLLVLKVLGGCFYWQTGTSFYVWITGFNHMVGDVSGLFLALSCVIYTLPTKASQSDASISLVPFVLSCVFLIIAAFSGTYSKWLFPFIGFSRAYVVWIGSFAFLWIIALSSLWLNGRYLRRKGFLKSMVAAVVLAPALAIAPLACQVFALEPASIPLILSASLSACAFAAIPTVLGRDKPSSGPVRPNRDAHSDTGLSTRENEIAELILDGKTNGEIAELLFISRKTVETHLYNMFRKLNVTNRVQLVRRLLSNDQ